MLSTETSAEYIIVRWSVRVLTLLSARRSLGRYRAQRTYCEVLSEDSVLQAKLNIEESTEVGKGLCT